MIRIKVPATSANLAVGFDSLGVALNLYNSFVFEASESIQLIGFEDAHQSPDNLVLKAYVAFASQYGRVKPVRITLEHTEIPVSRGLGSSASCIIAGVFAANILHDLQKTDAECVQFAASYEGHPDNVYAAFYGSLTAVMSDEVGYYHQTFPVSPQLKWNLLIPTTKGDTASLRSVLPNMVDFKTAVFHLSRMIYLPNAFKDGDIKLLKRLLQDRLHEEYRYPAIPMYTDIQALKNHVEGTVTISGSGPSILIISKKSISGDINHLDVFDHIVCSLSTGTKVEVLG